MQGFNIHLLMLLFKGHNLKKTLCGVECSQMRLTSVSMPLFIPNPLLTSLFVCQALNVVTSVHFDLF